MERHYGLPIAFAAAAHAAPLFGFNKEPRVVPPKSPEPTIFRYEITLPEPETPSEPEPASEKTTVTAAPDAPLPGLVEPIALVTTEGFTIPPPPLRPVSIGDFERVLEGTIGVPGGEKGGFADGILSSLKLDNPPRTRLQAAPLYPFESKRDGLHGEVLVEFVVDESGSVREPRVVSSSHRVFEEPTLRAVAKWKFEPGRRDGRIVSFKMAVPVVFKLHD